MRIDPTDFAPVELSSNLKETTLHARLQEAEKTAKEFESIFLDMMMKTMRETAKPADESNASSVYRGMLDSEYVKSMAEAQSFGIRDMVLDWMKQNDPILSELSSTLPSEKNQAQLIKSYENPRFHARNHNIREGD